MSNKNENKTESKVEEKKVATTNTNTNVESAEVQIMRNELFVYDITMTIDGWTYGSDIDYEKNESFLTKNKGVQFQGDIFNKDLNKFEKKTFKLNAIMEEDELNSMVGKTYKFEDAEDNPINGVQYFSSKVKPIEVKNDSGEDVYEKEIRTRESILIKHVYNKTEKHKVRNKRTGKMEDKIVETSDCVIQSKVKFPNGSGGLMSTVLDITIKNAKRENEEVQKLINKKLVVKDLDTFYLKDKGTFMVTEKIPSI